MSSSIEFDTGAKRDDVGRGVAFHLLCPSALEVYAAVCQEGAAHYGERNWERGLPTSNYIDHALEHLMGSMHVLTQAERMTHLGHALWNIAAAIHNETGCSHHDWKE